MKTIKPLLITLASGSLLIASTLATELSTKFTVAIIKDVEGSRAIKSGDYRQGLKALSIAKDTTVFDKSMGLCVANLQTERYTIAKSACSEAINAISEQASNSYHSKRLTALAYSNRAIVNYYLDNEYAALSDLTTALLLAHDPIIVNNLHHLKKSLGGHISPELAMAVTE